MQSCIVTLCTTSDPEQRNSTTLINSSRTEQKYFFLNFFEIMAGRILLIAAEDTEQAANACAWTVRQAYREGDELHLVYVVCALKPPMEVSGVW